jgi:hypothetical protein
MLTSADAVVAAAGRRQAIGYSDGIVRSVADDLRDEDRRALLALSADERVQLAFTLGERDLEAFRLAHDPPLSRADAARLLQRRRQAGRRPCRCIEELIG